MGQDKKQGLQTTGANARTYPSPLPVTRIAELQESIEAITSRHEGKMSEPFRLAVEKTKKAMEMNVNVTALAQAGLMLIENNPPLSFPVEKNLSGLNRSAGLSEETADMMTKVSVLAKVECRAESKNLSLRPRHRRLAPYFAQNSVWGKKSIVEKELIEKEEMLFTLSHGVTQITAQQLGVIEKNLRAGGHKKVGGAATKIEEACLFFALGAVQLFGFYEKRWSPDLPSSSGLRQLKQKLQNVIQDWKP